jgi:hypothetical protein
MVSNKILHFSLSEDRTQHSHCAETKYYANDADILWSFNRCSEQRQHHHHSQIHSSSAKAGQSTSDDERVHIRRGATHGRTNLKDHNAKHIDPFRIELTVNSSPDIDNVSEYTLQLIEHKSLPEQISACSCKKKRHR